MCFFRSIKICKLEIIRCSEIFLNFRHLWPGQICSRFADVLAKSRHFDLLMIIPASLQRDRSKLQTVRETWAKDIDSKTHLCQRHGDFWSMVEVKFSVFVQKSCNFGVNICHLLRVLKSRCNSERTVKYLFMLGEEAVEVDAQGCGRE